MEEVSAVVVVAIVACEIGFWVVLAAGLLARYLLHRPRTGAVLLVCVPLVDLALLALTVVDLRAGAEVQSAHGLAAVYLGFSVVFGHAMVRWADVRVAHRWGEGPAPEPLPAGGTARRLQHEWREFGSACLAAALSTALLLGAVALAPDRADVSPLLDWIGRLGGLLVVWLVGWPLWEEVRGRPSHRLRQRRRPSHRGAAAPRLRGWRAS